MVDHPDQCVDGRGQAYLAGVFEEIARAMGCENPIEAIALFRRMLDELELGKPVAGHREEALQLLSTSVNPVRLKNNPVEIDSVTAKNIYDDGDEDSKGSP